MRNPAPALAALFRPRTTAPCPAPDWAARFDGIEAKIDRLKLRNNALQATVIDLAQQLDAVTAERNAAQARAANLEAHLDAERCRRFRVEQDLREARQGNR